MKKKLPPQGTCRETGPSAVIQHAVDELRCTLGTIAGLAESDGHRAAQEIAMTARAGLARLDLICPQAAEPKEDGAPCEYFRVKECLAGCPRTECQEAGTCQTNTERF